MRTPFLYISSTQVVTVERRTPFLSSTQVVTVERRTPFLSSTPRWLVTEHILTNLCTHFVICEIIKCQNPACGLVDAIRFLYSVYVRSIGSLESSILVTLNL